MDEGTSTTAPPPPPSSTDVMEERGDGATEAATTSECPPENAGADADEEGGGDVEMSSSTTEDEEDDTDEPSSSGDDDDAQRRQSPEDRLAKAVTCKEEGNAHFKSGELDRAGRSYRRGTAALKGLNEANAGDEQVKNLLVLLQTNLSMVCLRQEKYAMSRDVATRALDVDGGNVKALYRRAAAHRKLGDVEKARDDLRAALKVDPNNREVKRELLSIKRQLETSKEKERQAYGAAFQKMGASSSAGLYDDKEELKRRREKAEREALRKRKIRWEEECARRKAKSEPEISYEDWDREETKREEEEEGRRKEEEKKKREEERRRKKELEEERRRKKDANGDGTDGGGGGDEDGHDSSDEELLQSLKKENIRGYKKTSCGKTTSYFHRELSDQEKALIGDITPKRLGDEEGNMVAGTNNDVKVVERSKSKAAESAWNQARTWEERDTTEWCTEALRTRLKEAVATAGPCVALIKNMKDVKGDASFAVASGKKKYIFDYTAQLEFEVFGGGDDGDVIGSGSLWLPDVNSTIDDGHYEVEMKWSKMLKDSYAESASDLQSELISSVRNSVEKFVVDFNGHYS